MSKVIAIVGCNYGDEGKGLYTAYFANQFQTGYVVRHNSGAQVGHCQTGDTIIMSPLGLSYIKDIVGNTTRSELYPLINMNNEVEHTSLLFTELDKVIHKTTLSNGIELKSTPHHKFYVWNSITSKLEWVETCNLDKQYHQFIIPKAFDNYIGIIPSNIPDVEFFAFLIGLLNGDGYFIPNKKGYHLYFHINQQDLCDYVCEQLNKYNIRTRQQLHNGTNCIKLSFYSSWLYDKFSELGVYANKRENKRTPNFVMHGSKSIIANYIKGLFESDGTVKFHKQRNNISGQLSFTNISKWLVVEIQQLLYILGIHSVKVLSKSRIKMSKDPTWDVIICSNVDILKYQDIIGFISSYKRDKLNLLSNHKRRNIIQYPNRQGYIVKVNDDEKTSLLKLIKQYRYNSSNVRTSIIPTDYSNVDLVKICTQYHIIDIQDINYNHSVEQVYDVTMPITHSYIANGVISHNTVQLDDSTRHIFSHFGSGTFQEFPTVWGHRCVAHPFIFRKEREELLGNNVDPILLVHRECMVTTPYDMITNQIIESVRNMSRHGSCGLGFGETIERHEKRPDLSLSVRDLQQTRTALSKQLKKIRQTYLTWRLKQVFPNQSIDLNKWVEKYPYYSDTLLNDYLDAVEYFLEHIQVIKNYSFLNNQNIIFESGQGLLLDQHFGDFPHVTRSNTGLKNISEIVDVLNTVKNMTALYVSRTYTTRHGNGPLDFEISFPRPIIYADKTNITNEFQGALRYAPLNVTKMYNAIQYDLTYMYHAKFAITSKLGFTWMDFDQELICSNGQMYRQSVDDFRNWVKQTAYVGSNGPTINDVEVFKP